jgi:hypothetical protein
LFLSLRSVADPDFLKLVKSSISDIRVSPCLAIQGYAYHGANPNLLPQRTNVDDEGLDINHYSVFPL